MSDDNIPAPDQWVQDNYDQLVADENRNLTYEQVAEDARLRGDPILENWAHNRAAGNPTPDPEPEPARAKYEALKVAELRDEVKRRQDAGRTFTLAKEAVKEAIVDALVADDEANAAPPPAA